MEAVALLCVATLFASVAVRGQGVFIFNNRSGTNINARFVLCTDPPDTSSVGDGFKVHLFGGPEGTPIPQLVPLEPPTTIFRGPAGTPVAGYVVGVTPTVPGVPLFSPATILVRVSDGPSWDAAIYRFERTYSVVVDTGHPTPQYLPLGTSPLVLCFVPEPAPVTLSLFGLAAAALWQRWRLRR